MDERKKNDSFYEFICSSLKTSRKKRPVRTDSQNQSFKVVSEERPGTSLPYHDKNYQSQQQKSSYRAPDIYPPFTNNILLHDDIKTIVANTNLGNAHAHLSEVTGSPNRLNSCSSSVSNGRSENNDIDSLVMSFKKLNPVLKKISASLSGNNTDDNVLQKALINSPKAMLPSFDKANSTIWLRLVEKRLKDYNITDSYLKYQLIVNLFDIEDLEKLEPFLSCGNKSNCYDFLRVGIKKVFLPCDVENELMCQRIRFDGSELPSLFAGKLRVLIGDEISEDNFKIKLHCKLNDDYMNKMAQHIMKPLNEYLEIADSIYSCGSSARSAIGNSNSPNKELESSNEWDMMVMLTSLQGAMEDQSKKLVETQSQLFDLMSKVSIENQSLIVRDHDQYNHSAPYQHELQCNQRLESSVIVSHVPLNFNGYICINHQKLGRKCRNCNPMSGKCDWSMVTKCDRHQKYGNFAHMCDDTSTCQYLNAVGQCRT